MTEHEEATEVELISQEHNKEAKCNMCGFRSTTLYRIGEDEPAEFASCAFCTVGFLSRDKYTILRHDTSTEHGETG